MSNPTFSSAGMPPPPGRVVVISRDRGSVSEVGRRLGERGVNVVGMVLEGAGGAAAARALLEEARRVGAIGAVVNWGVDGGLDARDLFFLSQAAQGVLKENGGKIVQVGSMGTTVATQGNGYPLTQRGLAQLTRTMAVEWERDRMQVNAILLGTSIEDALGALMLLLSAGNEAMTGQTLIIDHGASAGGSWD